MAEEETGEKWGKEPRCHCPSTDRHTNFYKSRRVSASLAHFNDRCVHPVYTRLRRLRNNNGGARGWRSPGALHDLTIGILNQGRQVEDRMGLFLFRVTPRVRVGCGGSLDLIRSSGHLIWMRPENSSPRAQSRQGAGAARRPIEDPFHVTRSGLNKRDRPILLPTRTTLQRGRQGRG
jgi:hypothetical protein